MLKLVAKSLPLLLVFSSAYAGVMSTATFGGSTYYLLTEGSWTEKEAEAVSLGGHLATVNSAAENAFLLAFWQNNATNYGLWIGLNDAAVDGIFVWSSGASVTYTNWPVCCEPNGGTVENWVHLHSDGFWNDNSNDRSFQGIAQVTPEPGMMGVAGLLAVAALRMWSQRGHRFGGLG